MKKILLAGYGWFASIPEGQTNNAELIARALDGEILRSESGEEAQIISLIVPVIWKEAFAPVESAIRMHKPDLVLALGTDARACAMRPEPYGVNWMRGKDAARDGSITDMDEAIVPGGDMFLRGTLPFEAMTLAMLRAGIPAQLGALSDAEDGAPLEKKSTTGFYLCNYMAYRLALLAKTIPGLRTGFMHVPTQPEYACAQRLSQDPPALDAPMHASMPLDMMIRGTREALRACIG
ncbi:MAG: hypothetical protein IKU34_09845 [Clostridia bacterium]|nr:hypothetical protein [Clostridia bacterium]